MTQQLSTIEVKQESSGLELIRDQLVAAGVTMVSSLPDNWIGPLIRLIDADNRFLHVPYSREESAVAFCTGAFFAGKRAVAVMGTSGFTTCIYALTKVNFQHQIPVVILMTLRGTYEDPKVYQVYNGLITFPIMEAIGMPYHVVDTREKIAHIPAFYEHARVQKRPLAICLPRAVLQS